MTAPGYSGTPLPKKLGIKPEGRVLLLDAPRVSSSRASRSIAAGDRDRGRDPLLSHRAARAGEAAPGAPRADRAERATLDRVAEEGLQAPTDITENVVREIALANALVDNKVAAVTDIWSGLQLVIRVKDRLP